VGTLVEVGKERIKPIEVREILESKEPTRAPYTAKPHGLYLHRVFLEVEK
jgi:tRNA pseudouridine38-40 synthase